METVLVKRYETVQRLYSHNLNDSTSCDQTTAIANARFRIEYFSYYVPLNAALGAFVLCSAMALLLLSGERLKGSIMFYVCMLAAVMNLTYIIMDSTLIAKWLSSDFCVQNYFWRMARGLRGFRSLGTWVADLVLLLRLRIFFSAKIVSHKQRALVLAPCVVVKTVRLSLMIWCLCRNFVYMGFATLCFIEYLLQLIDNLYVTIMIFNRLRSLSSNTGFHRNESLNKRIETLICTTVSGFLIPLMTNAFLVVVTLPARYSETHQSWYTVAQFACRIHVALTTINVLLITLVLFPKDYMAYKYPEGSSGPNSMGRGSSRRSKYVSGNVKRLESVQTSETISMEQSFHGKEPNDVSQPQIKRQPSHLPVSIETVTTTDDEEVLGGDQA